MPYTICLTGHRPNRLDGYNINTPYYRKMSSFLDKLVDENVLEHGSVTLRSGMALGADTIWAMCIIDAKKRHPGKVTFIADVPCVTQKSKWRGDDQRRWDALVAQADDVVIYSQNYTRECMNQRNKGMVDNSDMVIAIWDGSPIGGTAHAVRYSKMNNKRMVVKDPQDFK